MIDLEPLQLGMLGCGLLVGLCLIGVRIAFAAAIVGTLGLVSMLGWSRGISAIGTIPHATTSNYTLSVLPMFILIGYLAYYARITRGRLRGGAALVRLDAGRPCRRHRLCGGRLLGGVRREYRGSGRVRQGRHPRDAEGRLRQAACRRRRRGRRHARQPDSAERAARRLRHHRRGIDRQAADRRLRARHLLGARLHRDHQSSCALAQPGRSAGRSAASPGASASLRCPARSRSCS